MKKVALLLASVAMTQMAAAQVTLSGTSYTQNFNSLSPSNGSLPTGWAISKTAGPNTNGTVITLPGSDYNPQTMSWTKTTGGFRNSASTNNSTVFAGLGTDSAAQAAFTDRSLAIRQTSSLGDSGAAFMLNIANTQNLTNFQLSFKLQSQDSTSPRTTTWRVDYGFGSNPASFTVAPAVGTLTTGGNTFSNNTITVNFGSALDNQSQPVWIRIVTVAKTTGTSNRATTGIDDFNLSWTGNATGTPNFRPVVTTLNPANNATGLPASTSSISVTFDRNITAGAGNIYLRNETDQVNVGTYAANGANVSISGKTATISGFTLAVGKTYNVKIDSAAFDTAGQRFLGIYDSLTWRFATVPAVVTVTNLNETFDAACAAGPIPNGWSRVSVTGSQQWNCYTVQSSSNTVYRMNGFQTTNNANEDWLITPRLDLSAPNTIGFRFSMWKRFSGTEPQVLVSNNYNGDVTTATWTPIAITTGPADTSVWRQHNFSITPYKATPFYVAFKYVSTTTNGYDLRLDSVMTMTTTSAINIGNDYNMPVSVIGKASENRIVVGFAISNAAMMTAAIYDLNGREVYRNKFSANAGKNQVVLTPAALRSGMYFIRLSDGSNQGMVKAIVE